MNDYIIPLRKYATFSGRASRQEYWRFALPCAVIAAVLVFIDLANGTAKPSGTGLLSSIFLLAIFLPVLAASVRRLHDTGRSGYWALLSLIPWVGGIITCILYALPGVVGENKYGQDPLGESDALESSVSTERPASLDS